MLIFILIDVQYSQNADFSFEKGMNCQNHSSSGSHHPAKKYPPVKFLIPLPHWGNLLPPVLPLTAIWKTLQGVLLNIFSSDNLLHKC